MADGKDSAIVLKSIGNLISKYSVAANAGLGNLSADFHFNGFTQTVGPIVGTPSGTIVPTNVWANFELGA